MADANSKTDARESLAFSKREREIQPLLRTKKNSAIADQLFISEKTVKWHLTNMYKKARAKSRAELAAALA